MLIEMQIIHNKIISSLSQNTMITTVIIITMDRDPLSLKLFSSSSKWKEMKMKILKLKYSHFQRQKLLQLSSSKRDIWCCLTYYFCRWFYFNSFVCLFVSFTFRTFSFVWIKNIIKSQLTNNVRNISNLKRILILLVQRKWKVTEAKYLLLPLLFATITTHFSEGEQWIKKNIKKHPIQTFCKHQNHVATIVFRFTY